MHKSCHSGILALQRGRRFSLPARTVSLVLPGVNYAEDDVQRFASAAEAADMSLLEIAWAIAAESPRSYSLAEMAKLLFDGDQGLQQYITFCMLLHDEIYFQPVSGAGSRTLAHTFDRKLTRHVSVLPPVLSLLLMTAAL